MVVVMTQEATEADIEAVCERARTAGGEAFVSKGTVHTVVGLVGDTERFEAVEWTQLPGVSHVIKIGKAYKMVVGRPAPDADDGARGADARRPRDLHADRGAVRGRELRPGDGRHEGGQGRRRHDPARRRLQAADLALLVPGTRRGGARDPAGVPPRDRAADRRRGGQRLPGPARRRGGGLHPRRDAQRPELRAAEGDRPREHAGDAEARARDDDRRVAPGGRVRRATRATARSSCASAGSAPSSRRPATRSTSPGWPPPSTSRTCR